jgi:predicted Zn-dependent protease
VVLPYYSSLHYHWKPTCWTRPYRPVYYNYGYTVSGTWLGVGGATIQYFNPFAVPTAGYRYFDYTQPIRPPLQGVQERTEDLVRSERAMQSFDQAREWFRRGNAFQAEKLVDAAIGLLPNDPTLHQFRALVVFSQKRYQEAAAVLYSVLAVSPGWDLATITSLYGSIDQYSMQVNQLAQYAATNPQAVDAQFLLAYHYAIKGDSRAALRQLQRVQQARPDDRVVASLMNAIAGDT